MKKKHIILLLLILLVTITSGCTKKNDTTAEESIAVNVTKETTAPAVLETVVGEQQPVQRILYPAFKMIEDTKKYGFIDEKGTFVIEPVYSYATDFTEGRAIVTEANKSKVIDMDGNVVFESEFTIEPFHNGAAIIISMVNNKTLKGYIDTDGNIIISPIYERADNFNNDKAFVSTGAGKYEIIDKKGTVLESYETKEQYNNVIGFKDGYIIYFDSASSNYGVIDYKSNSIFEPNYSEINYLGNDLFGLKELTSDTYKLNAMPAAIFQKSGKQLSEFIYYDLSNYNGDYASATDSGYTYFIGLDGKEATDLPKVEGRGTLTLLGSDIIKADIDRDLIYMKKDSSILWQNDNTHILNSDIKVKEIKAKPNKYVLIYYPVVEGLKDVTIQDNINQQLFHLFIDNRMSLTIEDELSVEDTFSATLLKDLLIINKSGYDYPFGAAHGMPISEYYFVNINTGKFYRLKDLFTKNSDYVTKINKIISGMIKEQLKKGDSFLLPDGFTSIGEDQYFKITKDSLIIYFTPYEIAAYAAGFPEFEIPFQDLLDIIDKNGEFWTSFQ